MMDLCAMQAAYGRQRHLGRLRGAIHVHQKYTAAHAIKQDDWTDMTVRVSLLYNRLC